MKKAYLVSVLRKVNVGRFEGLDEFIFSDLKDAEDYLTSLGYVDDNKPYPVFRHKESGNLARIKGLDLDRPVNNKEDK